MRWIVQTSLRYPYLVVFIAAAMLIFGIARLRTASVDVFPEFAPPRVEIQTVSLGLSAADVEELVTVPLEQALNGVPGLDVMRSRSVPDLSDIVLIFKPGTDLILARQLVAERVAAVYPTLPTWAAPPVMIQPLSSTSRVVKIGISSDQYDLMDLSMIAYWKIRARLLDVPGVANAPIWGERIKMPQVQVDPERLRESNVPLTEVMDVTADALDVGLLQYSEGSVIGTGGFIDTPNQRVSIRSVLPAITPETLGEVPINARTKPDGTPLLLKDVGNVVWDTWPLFGDAVINEGPGLMMIVEKLPWANTMDVTRGVEEAINSMRPGLAGIDIDTTIFRPATFIEQSIENLTESLLVGAILVVIVLLFFLYEWRVALISATIIPLSLMASLLVLNLRGVTINVMTLAGLAIAIGAVVDDAIVDVENIIRRLRQLRREGSTQSTASIILESSLEVRGAIVYASLIEISALLPVFFLEGLSGAFFAPLAQAYVVAGLVSPLVALTVTPALVLIVAGNVPVEHRESPIIPWLHRIYDRVLTRTFRTPRLAYGTVGAIVMSGVIVWPLLGQELLPSFKERDFLMHWITKPGTSHPEMWRITAQACRELLTIPGVRNCGSHIGQALMADEPYGVYFTENWVSVDPAVDYDKTLASIQETVDGYPGLIRDVQTYLKERIREVLTGSSDTVVIRIYGPDLHTLGEKADEVRAALEGIDGIVDLKKELHMDTPQIQVEVNLEAARYYGLKPGDIRRATAFLVQGEEVGDIFVDGKTYDVNVWSIPETRDSLTDIRELLIDTPYGGYVRLADVADIRIAPVPNVIEREGQSRKIDVSANVRGRDLGSVARDVEQTLQGVEFPLEYHAEVLGEFAERQAAQQNILLAGGVAVIAIFFLLYTVFENWRLATLTFVTLPWALVGGLLAAFLVGSGSLSLGSLVGLLTILGIATRNGIMMISHFQHLEEQEGEPFGPVLVMRGARERIAPIMMTALTTGLALVPLAIAGDIPGHEIEYPMAIVILGGLATSTLLNLLVVPTLYLRFGKRLPVAWSFIPETVRQARIPLVRVLVVVAALLLLLWVWRWSRPAAPDTTTGSAPISQATTGSAPYGETTAASKAPPEAATGSETSSGGATGAQVAAEAPAGEAISDEVFKDLEELDRNNFDNPTVIDNEWFPLKPGTQLVYEGVTEEGGQRIPHRVIFTVTDLTKVIDGIRTIVVWDQDYSAGQLAETELAFFAQDNDGNVWHLGQYPEVYENGKLVEAPAWISGRQGARAGISMKAEPQVGAPSYSQGWGPAVSWTDRAQAAEMGVQTCVPLDCYEDVLVIEEFSRQEPNAFQLKYYARGVGNVRVGWKGEDATRETLELIELVELTPNAMAEAREQALALEERAYEISKEVYGQTPPAE